MSLRLIAAVFAPILAASAAAVTVTGFSPTVGRPGTLVTITGSGLLSATNVTFNPTAPILAGFVTNTDSQLTAVVPLGATIGPLSVNGVSSSASFTNAPTIASFSPQTGSSPTMVYIDGANFITNGTTVTFTGSAPVNGSVTASTVVGATVPSGAGDGPITVTTLAGSAVSTSNFTASSLPTITYFFPSVGPTNTSVTIHGGNFFGSPTVRFGGSAGVTASSSVQSTTEIIATVPYNATTGPIYVSTTSGNFTTGSNFITGAGPIITSFGPTVGTIGTIVTNYGYNFSTVTNVTINGVTESRNGYSSTYLLVGISAASGTGPIKVFSTNGNFTTSSNFSSAAGPVIGDFSPTVGGAGIYVVIDGLNFTGATSVKFNGTDATFHVTAGTQIVATVPNNASTGPISVTSSSGTFTTTSNFSVTTSAPFISSFSPSNGAPGTVVTINGANFTNISSIQFNGVSASFTPPTSTTVLNATVPLNASSGLISVTSSSGTGTSPSLFYIQPWITGATASGIVNSSLVISGRNLTNTSSVTVGGVNYPSFTNSPTQVVATVPSNAITGSITLTAPGGLFISTNSFVVLPRIYSFTPTVGPAGTVVTIGGTSLFDVTNVQFNGVSTTPFNVTTNQLQAAVPSGATPGPITVMTAGGNDVSTNIFTATYSSTVNLSKTASPIITGPGSNVTFTLVVTNTGPSTVTSLTVTDYIPNGFNFISATTTLGATAYTNNMVIASMPVLTNKTSVTITVKGTLPGTGAVTNTAGLGFTEGDTIYGTNYAAAYAYFVSVAQRTLGIAKSTNAGQFLVTWPYTGAPFTLQVNTNLNRAAGWQAPTNPAIVTNGLNEYSNIPPSPPAEFFRLLGP